MRRLAWVIGGLVGVLLLGAAVVWLLAERQLTRPWDIPVAAFVAPTGPEAVAAGERLATLRGCKGCHGEDLSGQVFIDEPWLARIPAPNLTALVPGYGDAELARTLRHGINPRGQPLVVMPSSMFQPLSDPDLGSIIAWLRSVPQVSSDLPSRRIRLIGRLGLLLGEFQVEPALIDHDAPRVAPDTADPAAWGKYLARTVCTECHGLDLEGDGISTPNLAIVAGYTEEEFRHLMRTGEPIGGRELDLMAQVARSRFSRFTDAEVGAVYAYLAGRRTGGMDEQPGQR